MLNRIETWRSKMRLAGICISCAKQPIEYLQKSIIYA